MLSRLETTGFLGKQNPHRGLLALHATRPVNDVPVTPLMPTAWLDPVARIRTH